MQGRPFINRILISLITAFSFIAMSLSGIAAFIVPQGKVAFWTNWTFIGLSKAEWGNIHITTSVLFLIAGIWHTFYNWSALMQYFSRIPDRMTGAVRDLIVAFIVTIFFTIGAVTKTPPLNYILTFNSWIKDSWVKSAADEPPFGHAELLSLKGFCKKMYINSEEALQELRQNGVQVADENVTVEKIAQNNKITPANVYFFIKKLEKPDIVGLSDNMVVPVDTIEKNHKIDKIDKNTTVVPAKTSVTAAASNKKIVEPLRYTGDMVVERFEGKGIGKKSLSDICQELKLDIVKIKKKLEAKQMDIKENESLKDAASRHSVVPIEILKVILVGEILQ